jgi:hypothetical protein
MALLPLLINKEEFNSGSPVPVELWLRQRDLKKKNKLAHHIQYLQFSNSPIHRRSLPTAGI